MISALATQNPRSTVATVTEIYDYLRLLMARLGESRCYQCGTRIEQQSPEQIVDRVLALPDESKTMLMAPLVRGRRGSHQDVLASIRKAGLVRARETAKCWTSIRFPNCLRAACTRSTPIVDRVIIREGMRSRIAESVDLADPVRRRTGAGLLSGTSAGPRLAGAICSSAPGMRVPMRPQLRGAGAADVQLQQSLRRLSGVRRLGRRIEFDPELVIPDSSLSLAAGAVAAWRTLPAAKLATYLEETRALCGGSHV